MFMDLSLAATLLIPKGAFVSLELMAGTANHSIALIQTGMWYCFIVDNLLQTLRRQMLIAMPLLPSSRPSPR